LKPAPPNLEPVNTDLAHRGITVEAYRSTVERAVAHMREHLDAALDLDEIADSSAISKFHLVRIFDKITGTTPHHFLACLRIQRAKELLLTTNASITEVCMRVGYSSLGSFSKTFNTLVGIGPQEFRSLPKRLTAVRFARTIAHYVTQRHKIPKPVLEGIVEGPSKPMGFTFVGTFTGGVPQGVPFSGTVLLGRGSFRVQRPPDSEFHLLAVLVPYSATFADMAASLPVGLVANLRVQTREDGDPIVPRLRLRPIRATDPPIVLALPALPPLKA
jgi:AraC family transcriptional regulator